MASENGRFFDGGYSGIRKIKNGSYRDYINESIRNIKKQIPFIKNIKFIHSDYRDIELPDNSIIYCDKPYQGTTGYSTSKNFDHKSFWEWAKEKSLLGHKIYISEYKAPECFECVWEKQSKSTLSSNGITGGTKKSTEKLFIYKS